MLPLCRRPTRNRIHAMNAIPKVDLLEATRLTREGRFKEAMAVLRGALPGASTASAPPDDGGTGSQTTKRRPAILDMVPPLPGTGGAWTASSTGGDRTANRRGGTDRSELPEAMRGLMDRIAQSGSLPGLDGRVGPAVVRPVVPLPDGARFDERTYTNAAGSRAYKLYVPSGYAGQALPLVVMLHGCTQSPDDFAAGTRMNEVAEEQTFLVAYPAQTQAANMSKCWNWFSPGDQQRDQGEPSLIAGITRQIMRDFPVDAGRVYVTGLSAGGAAAAIMGATYPDLYAAIGIHSGLACGAASDMPSAFAAMKQGGSALKGSSRPVPTIVFHGDRDTTVNPVNGDQAIAQAAAGDLRTTVIRGKAPGGISYTRTVHADGTGRAVLEQWVLHEAGHAWSGGSPAGSYTEPRGPDASREMMRFFLGQPAAVDSVS
jgi:poly(hydroxyalkanoate) depolymerase family esterase